MASSASPMLTNVASMDEEERGLRYKLMIKKLLQQGWKIREVGADGNCMFRALAYQLYRDEERHLEVRQACLDYVVANKSHFENFINNEQFEHYVARKRQNAEHGNHIELQAFVESFSLQILIYAYSEIPFQISSHQENGENTTPIRLVYTAMGDNGHYNCVVPVENSSGNHARATVEGEGSFFFIYFACF